MRQFRLGLSDIAVPAPIRIASWLARRWCVIALEIGPEMGVGVEGAIERYESRLVA